LRDDFINFGFGADVNAMRWLIPIILSDYSKDIWLKPLLLVSAAQGFDDLIPCML
jgi:hypothetical protein